MSAAALVGMSPEMAEMAAMLVQQQTQQVQVAVVEQIDGETGGGAAPMVSSSVTAPGALEMFA